MGSRAVNYPRTPPVDKSFRLTSCWACQEIKGGIWIMQALSENGNNACMCILTAHTESLCHLRSSGNVSLKEAKEDSAVLFSMHY